MSNLSKFTLPRLYPIIDTSIVKFEDTGQVSGEILSGGARILQLRAKGLSTRETLSAARELRAVTTRAGIVFIVNDRVDIALITGADGVHLGQDDLPPKAARDILGNDAIIGVSTHGTEEARLAISEGADYISIGPVFPTDTKADTMAVQGTDGLKSVVGAAEGLVPVVAIGGIDSRKAPSLINSGAGSVAMISGLLLRENISGEVARIIKLLDGL